MTVSASASGLSYWQVPSRRMGLGIVTDIGLIGQAAARYRRNMRVFLTLCQGHRNSSQRCIDGGRDTDTKLIDTHLHREAQVTQGDCRSHKQKPLTKRNGKRCTCKCLKVTLTQLYSVMDNRKSDEHWKFWRQKTLSSGPMTLTSCWIGGEERGEGYLYIKPHINQNLHTVWSLFSLAFKYRFSFFFNLKKFSKSKLSKGYLSHSKEFTCWHDCSCSVCSMSELT